MAQPLINNSADKHLVALLGEQCEGSNVDQLMHFFVENGLLSPSRCRAFVVYHRVCSLVAEGKYVTEAMHLVAAQLKCSYECARKDYYTFAHSLSKH